MRNNIVKLLEATKDLKISYRLGYVSGGTPDIGVRGYNLHHRVEGICYQGCRDDAVVIDGVCWTICGDIYNKRLNERVHDLRAVHELGLNDMYVRVQAHTCIAGVSVTADLGKRLVCGRYALENGEGVLDLA